MKKNKNKPSNRVKDTLSKIYKENFEKKYTETDLKKARLEGYMLGIEAKNSIKEAIYEDE